MKIVNICKVFSIQKFPFLLHKQFYHRGVQSHLTVRHADCKILLTIKVKRPIGELRSSFRNVGIQIKRNLFSDSTGKQLKKNNQTEISVTVSAKTKILTAFYGILFVGFLAVVAWWILFVLYLVLLLVICACWVYNENITLSIPYKAHLDSFKLCERNPDIQKSLGNPIRRYGEGTKEGWKYYVEFWFTQDEVKYLTLKYCIEGTIRKATVKVEMKMNDAGTYEYTSIIADIDDNPSNRIKVNF